MTTTTGLQIVEAQPQDEGGEQGVVPPTHVAGARKGGFEHEPGDGPAIEGTVVASPAPSH